MVFYIKQYFCIR